MSRDDAALLDIAATCRRIESFTTGWDRLRFEQDEKTQAAVLHEIMILGEAVKRLSPAFVDDHPSIPWRLVARMRDILIHRYDRVDLDEVWRTVERDIPSLLSYVSPLLPRE